MTDLSQTQRGVAAPLRKAKANFEQLTGQRVERVVGMVAEGDGWRLTVEVVELERIPETTNVIATYDLLIGEDGEISEFARTRRYHRNRVDEDEGD